VKIVPKTIQDMDMQTVMLDHCMVILVKNLNPKISGIAADVNVQ